MEFKPFTEQGSEWLRVEGEFTERFKPIGHAITGMPIEVSYSVDYEKSHRVVLINYSKYLTKQVHVNVPASLINVLDKNELLDYYYNKCVEALREAYVAGRIEEFNYGLF